MQGLKEMLLQEKKHLEEVLVKAAQNKNSELEGYLRISVDGGKARYYHCINDRYGEYIPRDNEILPRELAQKTYNEAVAKVAEARLKSINRCLKGYSDDEIELLYEELHPERKVLVTPIEPTFMQIEEKWNAENYAGKDFQEGIAVIMSERGERVRSKSEKILADYFYRNGISYKYEKPLNLRGYGIVYPDFTGLNIRRRSIFIHEHMGRMDDPAYLERNIRKIQDYQASGYYPGINLILTFETKNNPFDPRTMDGIIKQYLL